MTPTPNPASEAAGKVRPNTFLLRCLKKGCPRTKRVPYSPDIPKKVVECHSYCPWHEPQGAKAYPEYYYDKNGRDISEEVNCK